MGRGEELKAHREAQAPRQNSADARLVIEWPWFDHMGQKGNRRMAEPARSLRKPALLFLIAGVLAVGVA